MNSQKKKICNVICDITSGGVESVIQNYFTHIDRSQYELDLITYSIQSEICAEKFRELGFNIIVVPPKRNGFLKSVRKMNDAIKAGHYDVIHAHLTEWNCIPLLLGKINGVKIRISHSHMAEISLSRIKMLLLRIQRKLILKTSTKLCACGEDAGKYLYGEDVFKTGEVLILNNAIDVLKFQPDIRIRDEMRHKLKIAKDTLCIGHIGRFLPQKNHTFLIDIFTEVLKLNPDSVLLLAGTGGLLNDIRGKCEKLGISDKVKFLGVRSDPERIYQAMDVFCLPSLFEGLPVVGIEVQAAKVPAILSDRISNKVKITDLVTFYSLDAMPLDWAKAIIGKRGYQSESIFPNEYDINAMSKKWESLYAID